MRSHAIIRPLIIQIKGSHDRGEPRMSVQVTMCCINPYRCVKDFGNSLVDRYGQHSIDYFRQPYLDIFMSSSPMEDGGRRPAVVRQDTFDLRDHLRVAPCPAPGAAKDDANDTPGTVIDNAGIVVDSTDLSSIVVDSVDPSSIVIDNIDPNSIIIDSADPSSIVIDSTDPNSIIIDSTDPVTQASAAGVVGPSDEAAEPRSALDDDSDGDEDFIDEDDRSSSLSIPNESIDFDLVYSLHSFAATVEGQANVVKGDRLVLIDDSNSYWWLVRVLKTQEIGYIPAENIETPFERLARLNKHRNVDVSVSRVTKRIQY